MSGRRHHPWPVVSLSVLLWFVSAEALSGPRLGATVVTPPAWPLGVRLEFRAATSGDSAGAAGLHAVDLDGDGTREIIVAAAARDWPAAFWYVLSHRPSGYAQTWVSSEFRMAITSLAVGAVDGDAAPEILVAAGHAVHVYDGRTRELQWTIETTAWEIRSLQVADVDSDGGVEMVFCAPNGLHVYDAVTGAAEMAGVLGECGTVAVGNVDGDAGLEIVLGNGSTTGYVVDGVRRSVQWSYPLGFGTSVRLGDLDGDGISEIVAASVWDQISVLDAVARVEEYAIYPWNEIGALEVADVEGDGPLEVIYGEGQWGAIHVLDGTTLGQKWEVENPGYGVTNVVVGGTDPDGAREVWWGNSDSLHVVDAATREMEWASLGARGPFYGLTHGDIDGNGQPDFLYTSLTSRTPWGSGDGLYFIHDAADKQLRYVSPQTTGSNYLGLTRAQAANLDGDPQLEVVVATSESWTGLLVCYDGLTHEEQWRASMDNGPQIWSVQIGDVDGDGQLEVVIGTSTHGPAGPFVYVIDAATGTLEWRSPSIAGGERLSLLRLAQIDDDAALEILVAEHGGRLFLMDGVTHMVAQLADSGVTALDASHSNGNGRAQIVVGTADGELRIVNPGRRRGDRVIGRYGAQIDGLAVRDVTGDGIADYAFAANGSVSVVGGYGRAILWQSGWIGDGTGAHDSLLLADIDLDGRLELMVNTENVGVDIYELAAP